MKPMSEKGKGIVIAFEARNQGMFIDTTKCLEGCRCNTCFQIYLDSVVRQSNASLPILLDSLTEFV